MKSEELPIEQWTFTRFSFVLDFNMVGIGLKIAVGTAVVMTAAPYVLAAVGFGPTGIAAQSAAAATQSALYGGAVAKGSLFSVLQSAGATGALATSAATTAAVSGALGVATSCAVHAGSAMKSVGANGVRAMTTASKATVSGATGIVSTCVAAVNKGRKV